ncbi:glycosyltransferase family 2 protein [Bacteroidota bacterium]
MPKLSSIIITKNEEENITRCLESIKDISDEIIIVDSFSEDNTEKICKKYNVRFFQKEFKGYASQRNFAAGLSNNDYVLFIDADEEISNELKNNINIIKEKYSFDAYKLKRLNNYCGKWIKHSGWYPDEKLRLYNKNKAEWIGEDIHEELILKDHSKISVIQGHLFHYTYPSISTHISDIEKYSILSARSKFKKGKRISVIFILFRLFYSFFYRYFIRLGILDGYYGFVISIISAYGNFIKDILLLEMHKKSRKQHA